MAFVDETLRQLQGKQVVIVTTLESDGFLQEIGGTLVGGGDGHLLVQQAEDESPTIININVVAWVYEESEEPDVE